MLDKIPLELPPTPILDRISIPKDLRDLQVGDLKTLAEELRLFLLYSVGQTGGHFGAGLGVVELTIALHYVYIPRAALIDVLECPTPNAS